MGQTVVVALLDDNNEDAPSTPCGPSTSAQLLAEVKRAEFRCERCSRRKEDSRRRCIKGQGPLDSDKRRELREALKLGVDADSIEGGPPKKAFQTYLCETAREDNAVGQTPENAAHQIAFLQRHELARRATHLRNTDLAAQAPGGRAGRPTLSISRLENVRSAENVGSIARRIAGASRP